MSNEQLLASIEEMLDRKLEVKLEEVLDRKLDEKLDKRFAAFEERMDKKMDKRFEGIEQRMDSVESMQQSILEGQGRMYISISETMETMAEKSEQRMKQYMDGIRHELTGRLDKIEGIVKDTQKRVSNVEVYVASIDKRVKKLERSGCYTGGFVSDNVEDFIEDTDEEE